MTTHVLACLRETAVGGAFWLAPRKPMFLESQSSPPFPQTNAKTAWFLLDPACPRETLLSCKAELLSTEPDGPSPNDGGLGYKWRAVAATPRLFEGACLPAALAVQNLDSPNQRDQAVAALVAGVPVWWLDGTSEQFKPLKAANVVDWLHHGHLYRSPWNGQPCSLDDHLQQLAEWASLLRGNQDLSVVAGIAWWKRQRIKAFFPQAPMIGKKAKAAFQPGVSLLPVPVLGPGKTNWRKALRLLERSRTPSTPPKAWWAGWASRINIQCPENCPTPARVEDGFIRSQGLGSGFAPPCSIIVDRQGIYFDPSGPSDLEEMLENAPLPPQLLKRAALLRQRLVAEGISKYGRTIAQNGLARLGAKPANNPPKPIILVPGQVGDDLSVLKGGGKIKSNAALLEAVRAANPNSRIIYRPHPDVTAGHRQGHVPAAVLARCVDEISSHSSILEAINHADEVHVLTSLAGFEALLRHKKVVTYGQPFYSGWGLTDDLAPPISRRNRRLTLDGLVAATLILYPRYIDPATNLPCPPETLLDRFKEGLGKPGWVEHVRHWQGKATMFLRKLLKGTSM
ncbi:capsular polysaccharide export protein, LipB/KpsS family [Formicincola oecophyllae]|uniref:capsular polysaccharide export protein, LipB/KpsS family n=1 Tax=Formicincola oecophyllae TaxID=2558361 RepID=UPI00143D7140|nr:hypothetical protein [Formicincola oecophyllae]